MARHHSDERNRGACWVIVQYALMIGGLASGPLFMHQWEGAVATPMGWLFLAMAAFLGIRGKRDLGNNRTAFPRPKVDAVLVTSGIYASMRHPLYVSVICIGFGWSLLWQSWPAAAVAFLQVPFFDAKARKEEQWLMEKFPDYEDYSRRVKRFLPGIY